ncbi:ATP-grasp domain-containing protein [Methylobacter sp. S3L5C]|uniref:ATP-grasp domain-containing protein n=1 Tax=Methylobacter sp. S3L5C TaxID=2839024 RepID=UPI001FABD084|nr:ATP-grasp domain-containing protein [Methylobacter sp. S3L5C]UOA09123.1 ATP-grasp domain-containing protein [Methylobacter sp. S3L5C]
MPTKQLQFEVLLIAGIDTVGLARFPYLLHNAGCRVTLLAPPGLAIIKSRHVDCYLHSLTEPQALVLHLKDLLITRHQPFDLVIVGDEPTLIAVAEHRGETWLDNWFPVDHRSAAVDVILSKLAFQQAAIAAGLSMPYSELCQDWPEVEAAVLHTGYPAMLKASIGLSGSGVHKVCDSSELKSAYDQLAPTNQPLLVQQFCEGALGSTDVLFDHGVPICWQSSYSLQCWPTPLASSSARELMQHPDIEAMLLGVGKITGYHGFAGVDWIHEGPHLYLLELNPRPTPTYHLNRHFGVNFSHSLNQLLSGEHKVTPPKLIDQPTPLIRLFPQSLYWAVSNRDWRNFIFCWNDAPWRDPLLMGAYLRRVLTHFLPECWREKASRWLRG